MRLAVVRETGQPCNRGLRGKQEVEWELRTATETERAVSAAIKPRELCVNV